MRRPGARLCAGAGSPSLPLPLPLEPHRPDTRVRNAREGLPSQVRTCSHLLLALCLEQAPCHSGPQLLLICKMGVFRGCGLGLMPSRNVMVCMGPGSGRARTAESVLLLKVFRCSPSHSSSSANTTQAEIEQNTWKHLLGGFSPQAVRFQPWN